MILHAHTEEVVMQALLFTWLQALLFTWLLPILCTVYPEDFNGTSAMQEPGLPSLSDFQVCHHDFFIMKP